MAKLDIEITKEAFEGLEDSIKQFYTETSKGSYELEGVGGKIRGLKSDLERFEGFKGLNPEEAKKAVETLKSLGVDEEAIKQALDFKKKADEKKVIDKEGYDALLEVKQKAYDEAVKRIEDEKTAAIKEWEDKYTNLFGNLKTEAVTNFLTGKGVLADRADLALNDVLGDLELEFTDGKKNLKKKDGIGDAKELDELIGNLKTKRPYLFKSETASGSGASGSEGNGGGQTVVTNANVITPTVSQLDALAEGTAQIK